MDLDADQEHHAEQVDYNEGVAPPLPQQGTTEKPVPEKRRRTLVLFFFIILAIIFSVAALPVTVMQYHKGDVSIEIGFYDMDVCPADPATGNRCERHTVSNFLCAEVAERLNSAGNIGVAAVLLEFLLLILLVLEYFGKMLFRSATYRLTLLLHLLLLVQWALVAGAFGQHLCKGTSFLNMGFKYAAGWALPFVLWLILFVPIILLLVLRKKLQ